MVERKSLGEKTGKVKSITRNEKQDYNAHGSDFLGWNVRIEGADEDYVLHTKGSDSKVAFAVGQDVKFTLTDVISSKGHWYYNMSIIRENTNFALRNKKKAKHLSLSITHSVIELLNAKKSKGFEVKTKELFEDTADKMYKFILGYNKNDDTYSYQNDAELIELYKVATEIVIFNDDVYKSQSLKDIAVHARNLVNKL